MWKNYSLDYIKNNRSGSTSIIAASFIAALFLSFLCILFYNFWLDNIEGTKQEDGGWHSRITDEISNEDLDTIRHFANVEKAVLSTELSKNGQKTADIYFHNKRTAYKDTMLIADALGLTESSVTYNFQLLSLYFIRIPGDDKPRLILPAYLAIVALVCISLILIIHNSFAVSANSRIHQFGILSSIGATPGQIRTALIEEAAMLSFIPILAGLFSGIALGFGTLKAMNIITEKLPGGRTVNFNCHPAILAAILLLSLLTVLISAYLPAKKLSRLSPLEAIRGTGELQLKKKKHSHLLSALFGIEGELAGNALKAQKKALRTTSLSLTFAFLGFMLMQCFFTLSGISTNHTYFERYQDAWDVMITVKDTRIEDSTFIEKIQELSDLRGCTIYQKAEASIRLPVDAQSQELLDLGGLKTLAGISPSTAGNTFPVKASLVIMDDKSFDEYCAQLGLAPGQKGTVLINRIWDSTNSTFRYPKYIPYIAETMDAVILQSISDAASDSMSASPEETQVGQTEIPVLSYTQEYPVLREEYDNYALVNVIPVSLWKEITEQLGGFEKDTYIRLIAKENASLKDLQVLEQNAVQLIGTDYETESENRIQEKITNDKMIKGYELVLGAFCVFLAIIGITHVFSNTLGFLNQRKREFARYMSVGLTPDGIRKIFCIEALVIVGRPLLITLLLTIMATTLMIRASYLNPMEFIRKAPVLPISAFILTVLGFVALAYYLGGRKIARCELAEALRDDTMM